MCVPKREQCCDHLISSVFTLKLSREIWRCCHCGRHRSILHRAEVSEGLDRKVHGPFAQKDVAFGPSMV